MLSALALFGCQSDREGFERLCAAADECTTCRGTDVARAGQALGAWVEDNVSNGTAGEAYGDAVRAADREARARLLREAASAAGVEPCALADYMANPRSMHLMWGTTDIDNYGFLAEDAE